MPYVVEEDPEACPSGKPFAVKTQGGDHDGRVHGCHPTEKEAMEQQKALYAAKPEAQKASGELGKPTWKL